MIVAVFEKYGFHVVPCVDQKTIILANLSGGTVSTPRKTMERILTVEDISFYVSHLEPFHVAGWKVVLW
jgi:hypothetical protein